MAGGRRKGAGRPKKEPTTHVRVPLRFKSKIEAYARQLLQESPYQENMSLAVVPGATN